MNTIESPRPKREFTNIDVANFYRDIILTWKPSSEVWSFKHGDDLTTGITGLTGIYITYYFRRQMKLRSHARMTCYVPVVGLSAIGTFLLQSVMISSDILSGKSCPWCITTKSTMIQLTLGLAYPLLVAPIVTFFVADRLLTYPVPSISRAPYENYKLWLNLVKKNPRPLLVAAIAHVLAASIVTQQKMSFVKKNWS